MLDEAITSILADSYRELAQVYEDEGRVLPRNQSQESKLRLLDCLVVNDCLRRMDGGGTPYDTVRGAFWEGEPIYAGAGFARESHVQVVVRNAACILGVFRPNLTA